MSRYGNPLLTKEDLDALERVERATKKLRLTARHVRDRGFMGWMRMFAVWYATEGNGATVKAQEARASFFAKSRVGQDTLRVLKSRDDFKQLVEKFQASDVATLRERFQQMGPKIADNIEWAIDAAREKEDYKAMPAVVEPVVSRILPKKDDRPVDRPSITIQLGTFAQQYLEAPLRDVEVEALPLPSDDDQPRAE